MFVMNMVMMLQLIGDKMSWFTKVGPCVRFKKMDMGEQIISLVRASAGEKSENNYGIGSNELRQIMFNLTKEERLDLLNIFFVRYLCEDQIEGTQFDCDVMDAITTLKSKCV